jgi:hypothetical protein
MKQTGEREFDYYQYFNMPFQRRDPTHLVEPEVPWVNILEVVQAAAEYPGQK